MPGHGWEGSGVRTDRGAKPSGCLAKAEPLWQDSRHEAFDHTGVKKLVLKTLMSWPRFSESQHLGVWGITPGVLAPGFCISGCGVARLAAPAHTIIGPVWCLGDTWCLQPSESAGASLCPRGMPLSPKSDAVNTEALCLPRGTNDGEASSHPWAGDFTTPLL